MQGERQRLYGSLQWGQLAQPRQCCFSQQQAGIKPSCTAGQSRARTHALERGARGTGQQVWRVVAAAPAARQHQQARIQVLSARPPATR